MGMNSKNRADFNRSNRNETTSGNSNKSYNPNNKKYSNIDFITDEEANRLVKEYFLNDTEYYSDTQNGRVHDVRYYDEFARALASIFIRHGNKLTQLRKFYNEIDQINRGIDMSVEFTEAKKRLLRLVNFAYRKQADSKSGVSKKFYEFLKKNVDYIQNNEQLNIFKQHFEAILCYIPRRED